MRDGAHYESEESSGYIFCGAIIFVISISAAMLLYD